MVLLSCVEASVGNGSRRFWRRERNFRSNAGLAHKLTLWQKQSCEHARAGDGETLASNTRIDRKPAFWESGEMKTTLDLPDELMREVKIRAVQEHRKLKDVIADFIRKGMAVSKMSLPKTPKPVKLRGGFIPTTEDIEAAISEGRD
ncbi:MAG: hypothetical protein DME60_09210 [Verrucomicrobia bacterium]|nr:MAG: hypothetical protein DME60_09210 [Verrucomicrobiota bacterium]